MMKNLKKIIFPALKNEYLENILRQLAQQHVAVQIFYTPQPSGLSYLVVHLEQEAAIASLQLSPWVRKAKTDYQIAVSFLSSGQLAHRRSLGHPFVACYCSASALIYQNEAFGNIPMKKSNWKHHRKKFKAFAERFYHDHDLQHSPLQCLVAEESSNSLLMSYGRLLDFDLRHLEELYCGDSPSSRSLDERINHLKDYVPVLQKIFVRGTGTGYYLTELLEKVKHADDSSYSEMQEAVAIAERTLYGMIAERHKEMKQRLQQKGEKKALLHVAAPIPHHLLPEEVEEAILGFKTVEEIYLYHETSFGNRKTYYLLLVGKGFSNELLARLTQSLHAKMGTEREFVLIGHDRYWIQSNLYAHQYFFSKVMQKQYLQYSSDAYHPELHWEVPYKPYHADLYFHYRPAKDSAEQFMAIASHSSENYQGLDTVFARFFLSFCRTIIFAKTYYLPNYLNSRTQWLLCLYADEGLRKYEYLIDTFWTDFFTYVDSQAGVCLKLSKLDKKKVEEMCVLVGKLAELLQEEVVEGGLLGET